MKNILTGITALALLILGSCSVNKSATTSNPTGTGTYQVVIDRYGNAMLWGKCTPEAFRQKPFGDWFQPQFNNYKTDSAFCRSLELNNTRVDIYMGTWCGDSKREVPRMLKVLDYCGINAGRLNIYTVSNTDSAYKQAPGNEAVQENIFRVPTFIFYNGEGKELGRIIESPVQTLEKDMAAILTRKPYVPHYDRQQALMRFCREVSDEVFTRDIHAEIEKIKDTTFSGYTLNNTVYVLMATGQVKRAEAIIRINEEIFPGDVYALTGKARYLKFTGRVAEAAGCCRKILEKEPANATAKEMLATLNK